MADGYLTSWACRPAFDSLTVAKWGVQEWNASAGSLNFVPSTNQARVRISHAILRIPIKQPEKQCNSTHALLLSEGRLLYNNPECQYNLTLFTNHHAI